MGDPSAWSAWVGILLWRLRMRVEDRWRPWRGLLDCLRSFFEASVRVWHCRKAASRNAQRRDVCLNYFGTFHVKHYDLQTGNVSHGTSLALQTELVMPAVCLWVGKVICIMLREWKQQCYVIWRNTVTMTGGGKRRWKVGWNGHKGMCRGCCGHIAVDGSDIHADGPAAAMARMPSVPSPCCVTP